MTNAKSTKRALFTSAFAILICVAMLIGTTFAWFTDTASTGVNKIQAGNLDVALEMNENGEWVNAEGKTLDFKKAKEGKNEEILWEPGCTYELPELRVVNNGNLALKYKIMITGINGNAKLNEAIEWTIGGVDIAEEGHLSAGAKTDSLTIKGHMKEEAGNEYQGLSIDGISITVYATQDTVEYDSFSNQYDAKAEYPTVVSRDDLNTTLTLDSLKDENGKITPVEVNLGDTAAEDISYSQKNSGYTGKGVMLGSTKLNSYAAAPAETGEYKFTFKNGTITSAATGYQNPDGVNGPKNSSVYMLVPGNSDVVFENMTFNGVVSFDIQKYTSPWSNLNSITFKNCVFNGIVVGTCPADNVTFDGCVFNNYTNSTYANNSNPIWWRSDTEGTGENANPIKTFTFVNNKVTSTRPVKIERIDGATLTFKNNYFDISKQEGDTATKNMAINIGQRTNTSAFTLIDEGNTISGNTASLYTAALVDGSNQYVAVSGNKVLDGNGNNKVITAMVWKTTSSETFKMKTID